MMFKDAIDHEVACASGEFSGDEVTAALVRPEANAEADLLRKPLRVGVLLDKPTIPLWLAEAIEAAWLTTIFTGLIIPPHPTGRAAASLGCWVLQASLAADRWRTGVGDGLTRQVQAPFSSLTLSELTPEKIVRTCAHLKLDLLLLACDLPHKIEVELSRGLPLGVCQIVTEHRNAVLQACPGAATLSDENPILQVSLVLRRGNATRIVCHAENRLHRSALSVNAERLLRPPRSLLRDGLCKLRNSVGDASGEQIDPDTRRDDIAPNPLGLGNSLNLVTKVARRIVRNLPSRKHREQWAIGVMDGTDPARLARDPDAIRWTDCDPASFIADPFPIEHRGVTYVFVEELPYATGKGHISVMELGRDGSLSRPVKVLACEHHLSFPFVFEHGGQFYMIPERSAGGSIVLYEAVRFPFEWREARCLVPDFPGLDTVLYEQGGTVWLFTSSAADLSEDSNLHLFSAPSIFGAFKPHPLNPVRNGLRGSRMAGALFQRNGIIYRPAQISVQRYGHSVTLNRIEELGPRTFRETPTQDIVPNNRSRFPLALHTINFAGGATIVDGLRMTPV